MADKMTADEREEIEESLFSCHMAADQYLLRGKNTHEKMLKMSVDEALELLEKHKQELQKDPRLENYKLHLFVPMQIVKLLEMRKDQPNVEQP